MPKTIAAPPMLAQGLGLGQFPCIAGWLKMPASIVEDIIRASRFDVHFDEPALRAQFQMECTLAAKNGIFPCDPTADPDRFLDGSVLASAFTKRH